MVSGTATPLPCYCAKHSQLSQACSLVYCFRAVQNETLLQSADVLCAYKKLLFFDENKIVLFIRLNCIFITLFTYLFYRTNRAVS